MSLRPILIWPDLRLNTVCPPVEEVTDAVRQLAMDMLDTMYDAPGRGLAAPQVGVMSRVFVMDVGWKDGTPEPVVFINPQVLSWGEKTGTIAEACLSIPGVTADVIRPTTVQMVWTDLDGLGREQVLSGPAARCAQHELDHLNGLVTLDRVDAAQRADILARYETA